MDGALPWIILGVAMWFLFASPAFVGEGCGGRKRKGKGSKKKDSEELVRLRAELADSHAQIDRLTARLEALETIVTDEERTLRREFRELERASV